ncbi:MAG: DUF4255 domain-containing protein [Bacteroidales bacterium]|nr:DUF4255 domain-containing protein [Bacteroidales bacterium]
MALGDSNIIGDVTDTLVNLLSELDVTLDSPAELKGNSEYKKINLYLYQVLENAYSKNQPWLTDVSGKKQYPPLALNLYFLLTPYASDTKSAHEVLSYAMRIFYENSIMKGDTLAGSLRLVVEQLRLIFCPMELEELTRIWNALQSTYRLSVCYEVSIVLIESEIVEDVNRVMKKTNIYSSK